MFTFYLFFILFDSLEVDGRAADAEDEDEEDGQNDDVHGHHGAAVAALTHAGLGMAVAAGPVARAGDRGRHRDLGGRRGRAVVVARGQDVARPVTRETLYNKETYLRLKNMHIDPQKL
jgi:hypothetical protein